MAVQSPVDPWGFESKSCERWGYPENGGFAHVSWRALAQCTMHSTKTRGMNDFIFITDLICIITSSVGVLSECLNILRAGVVSQITLLTNQVHTRHETKVRVEKRNVM